MGTHDGLATRWVGLQRALLGLRARQRAGMPAAGSGRRFRLRRHTTESGTNRVGA